MTTASRLAGVVLAALATPVAADVVDLLEASNAAVEDLGSTGGLAGYQVTPDGEDQPYTLYVTPEGYAVVGLLYDPQGHLLTANQVAAHASPPPQPPPAPTAPVGTSDASSFIIGTAGPLVRVYADPACRFSRGTVARLAAAAIEGRLILEVLPVALLGTESARLALAASGAAGAEAWFARRIAEPDPLAAARVRANNQAFRAEGGIAVPLVVWRDAAGARQLRTGAIDDVAAFLAGTGP